jgi:hypothetical protein
MLINHKRMTQVIFRVEKATRGGGGRKEREKYRRGYLESNTISNKFAS